MPQIISLQYAARRALAAWLRVELAAVDGLVVEPDWFERDRELPPKALSIIDAGPRQTEWLQPEILAATNVDIAGPPAMKQVDATWNFGFITQPLQLDVWAPTKPQLDDIIARLDASLNKGARGLGVTNAMPFAPGLQMNLGDGWAPGIADVLFTDPDVLESPDSVGQGEWRAMYRGRATAQMTQVARSPRIARILLEQRLRERDPIDTADPPDTTIILPTD